MRYLIKFSYDGTNYSGFQKQKGLKTIEEELEKALTKINNNVETKVCATGRTDKGVHALCQYAHTDLDVKITEKGLKRALNSNLPEDIHVIDAHEVDESFHARYNVKEKTYNYYINVGEYNPVDRNYVFQYNHKLDIESMKKAIKYLKGKHDFRSFVKESKDKPNCIRKITNAEITRIADMIIITFTADGFLRCQVRNMVGILIKVGEGRLEAKEVKKILKAKDRKKAGKTAPPQGLFLMNVTFKQKI